MKTWRIVPMVRFPARVLAALLCLITLTGLSAPGANAAVSPKASRYYEDALKFYERGEIPSAVIQLKNAVQIDPGMLPAQLLLGKALLSAGEVVAAEVALYEAMRLGVNRAEVVEPLAQAFLAQGKQRQVIDQAEFQPAGLPPVVQRKLLLLRASAHSDLGDAFGALRSIEQAKAIDPTVADPWIAEVPVRIRDRQFREAIEVAKRALALAPNSAEAWYQQGAVQHVMGDLKAALAAYDRAVQANEAHIEARVARAGLYIDFGRNADAAKDVADLRRRSPKEPRGAYLLALLAERDKNPAAASAALREVTSLIDPVPLNFIRYRPQLLMLNGLAHFGLNEREKAKAYLEPFQRVQGNSAASKLLAQIYLGEGNFTKAGEILETYLKAQPGDAQAMTLLASAYSAQGRYGKATYLMQEALRSSDAPEFHTALGLSLIGGGQIGSGIRELEAVLKKDPGNIQVATALIGIYLREGQAAKAILVAETLVKRHPTSAAFFNMLGMAHGQAGRASEARAAFEQAIKLDDNFIAAKINLARLDSATRAFDAAAKRLTAILEVDAKNSEAMYEMAIVSERRGQREEAQRWLEKANDAAEPKDTRWGLALIDFCLRNGRAARALEVAKRLSARNSGDVAVLLALARTEIANKDAASAMVSLGNATRLADFNPARQVEIALLQMQANNLAGAAYSLEKALAGQPDFLPALALMTAVELRQGEAAKAATRARQIAEMVPKRAIGYSLLGDVAMAGGKTSAALEHYRRAYQVEPSTETALRLIRAVSGQEGGKPAQQVAGDWLKTHPGDNAVRKALADVQARNGNYAMARTTYEAVLRTAPADAEALNNLANVLLRLKDAGAVKVAERALAASPGNPLVIDTLGWALFQAGDIDRALLLLRDARLREPGNPEIRYHLAAVLAKTGRKDEAREELEAALKAGRNFEDAADAEQLLRSLK